MVFIFVASPSAYLSCKLFSQLSSSAKFLKSSTEEKTVARFIGALGAIQLEDASRHKIRIATLLRKKPWKEV